MIQPTSLSEGKKAEGRHCGVRGMRIRKLCENAVAIQRNISLRKQSPLFKPPGLLRRVMTGLPQSAPSVFAFRKYSTMTEFVASMTDSKPLITPKKRRKSRGA